MDNSEFNEFSDFLIFNKFNQMAISVLNCILLNAVMAALYRSRCHSAGVCIQGRSEARVSIASPVNGRCKKLLFLRERMCKCQGLRMQHQPLR